MFGTETGQYSAPGLEGRHHVTSEPISSEVVDVQDVVLQTGARGRIRGSELHQRQRPDIEVMTHSTWLTPSIAFRHLPPNSARFGYATKGVFFISAQLSTEAVSTLRKVWLLIRLWKQPSAQARM